jgi:hypothetical protein
MKAAIFKGATAGIVGVQHGQRWAIKSLVRVGAV